MKASNKLLIIACVTAVIIIAAYYLYTDMKKVMIPDLSRSTTPSVVIATSTQEYTSTTLSVSLLNEANAYGSQIGIYETSGSSSSTLISTYTTPNIVAGMALVNNYLLLGTEAPHPLVDNYGSNLEIVDISDPAQPVQISNRPFNGELIKGITFRNGVLIFSGDFGIQTIDYSNINNLKIVSSTPAPEVFALINGILPHSVTLGATTTINFSYRSGSGIATTSVTMNGDLIADGQQITFGLLGTTTIQYYALSNAGASTTFTQQIFVQPPVSEFTSSSTVQVGDFTVVANCTAISADSLASVGEIDILKGSSTLQTILTTGIAPGGNDCPKPESKDINSDGYPDFMIISNYGNAADDYEYWLYNSSTNQFYCPNTPPSGKPWMACSLVESF